MTKPTGKAIVSDDQNKKNKVNEELINKELKEYDERYKNILWIDDDCNDRDEGDKGLKALKANLRWLKNCDENQKHMVKKFEDCYNIKTVKYFYDAVMAINDNAFDLVIFDINLEKGFNFDKNNDDVKKIEDIFVQQHIEFKYNNFFRNDNNRKIAGEYLYLLLLSKGYPQNRMIIYTNNYNIFQTHSKLSTAGLFNFKNNSLFISKNDSIDINKYFCGTDEYYRIRRLIFQACDYWEKRLKQLQEIPFDKIYDLEDEKEAFIDMLSQVKMMFPVIKPSNPEEVYYQAMHIISMFHEEKAKINKVENKKNIYPYHQMIRYFRNWSSHNKFKKSASPAETNYRFEANQFAFLFCVAIRTYFDTQKIPNPSEGGKEVKYEYYLNNKKYYYEEVYFSSSPDFAWNDVINKIESIWKDMLRNVNFYGGRINKENLLKNIDLYTLLQRLGEQQNYHMPFYYINLLMFKSPFKMHIDINEEPSENPIESNKILKASVTFNYSLQKINANEYTSQFTIKNNVNEFFEKIAFSLLSHNIHK